MRRKGCLAILCAFWVVLTFSSPRCAEEMDSQKRYEKAYFDILKSVDIAKSKSRSQLEREEHFAYLINAEIGRNGSDWLTLKDGLMEILIADPGFFLTQVTFSEGLLTFFKKSFSLHWLYRGKSNYPELKQLALKQIEREIDSLEERLRTAHDLKRLIEATKPTVLDEID